VSLLLRYDEKYDVLRSLGDPPNGTLVCGIVPADEPGHWIGRLHVDCQVDRPANADGPYTPNDDALTDVEVGDAVAACVGQREVEMLCSLVAGMALRTLGTAIPHWDVEAGVAVLELMDDVRAAVTERCMAEGWVDDA
jgi:hypothetical protein